MLFWFDGLLTRAQYVMKSDADISSIGFVIATSFTFI